MTHTQLSTRAVLRISGADRFTFLQGLITNDIELLRHQPALFAAILNPQGKWLYDFFIYAQDDAFLLDCNASQKEALIKTLKMYKLRADVQLEDVSEEWHIIAGWGETMPKELAYTDPRFEALGWRQFSTEAAADHSADYMAHRLTLGVAEGIEDATERTFPMELGYDQLHAISFTKGCYVGQEVTARMHYRQVLPKMVMQVKSETALPEFGTEISANDQKLGELRSHQNGQGLAVIKRDAWKKLDESAPQIHAGDTLVTLRVPPYMEAKLAQLDALENTSDL